MIMPFFKFIGIEERESYGFISNDVHNRLPPSELLLLIANPHTLLLLPNSSSVSIRPSYCNALSVVRLYIFSLNLYSKNLQTHFSSQQFTEPEIKQLCVVSRDFLVTAEFCLSWKYGSRFVVSFAFLVYVSVWISILHD